MARILVGDPIAEEGIDILREAGEVDIITGRTEDQLLSIIGEYDAFVVRSETRVTSNIIDKASKLKVIARAGVGVDNIDVEAATARGILVINSPEGNTLAAAELTMALLLSLSRNIPQADDSVKSGKWERKRFTGVEVYGKILGLIGLGKIGREVARRARAFEMQVIAYDPFLSADSAQAIGVELVDLSELYRRSDFISLHVPRMKETLGLIDEQAFRQMKRGVRLINASRGGIIDESALLTAIEHGRVAGVALDVFTKEPPSLDDPLIRMPNVVTTPHLGASTQEAQTKVAVDVAEQIVDVLQGRPARSAVNLPAIPSEVLSTLRPYLMLAERMGSLLTQTSTGRIQSVEISCCGELGASDVDLLTRAVLVGLLKPILSEEVNFVNAPVVARTRGIEVTEASSSTLHGYTSLLSIDVTLDTGQREVAGTVFGRNELRIVRLDGLPIDLVPEGVMLVVPHADQPGMVGKVGSILGDHGINIGGMRVGRVAEGQHAVMVLMIDSEVSDEIRRNIAEVSGIEDVRQVVFSGR